MTNTRILEIPGITTGVDQEIENRSVNPLKFYAALKSVLDNSRILDSNLNFHRLIEVKINGSVEIYTLKDFIYLKEKLEKEQQAGYTLSSREINKNYVSKVLACDIDFLKYIFDGQINNGQQDNKVDLLVLCHPIQDFRDLDLVEFIEKCRPIVKNRDPQEARKQIYSYYPMLTFIPEGFLKSEEDDTLIKDAPFIKYLNSSIWNFLVPIPKNKEKKHEIETSSSVTRESLHLLSENFDKGFYETINGFEFLEFRTRMLKNSYIASFKFDNGHLDELHKDVIPYRFYSRGDFKEKLDVLKKSLKGYAWKLLLVDDKAEVNLTVRGERESIPKLALIENLLRNEGFSIIEDPQFDFKKNLESNKYYVHIECASTLKEFKAKLKQKNIYDIILLDYLLDTDETTTKRNYGTDFFSILRSKDIENEYIRTNPAPFKYYWIFPITVFNNAFFDYLQQEGINFFDQNFRLYRGADPLNTPTLFLYNLIQLMGLQIQEAPALSVEKVAGDFIAEWEKVTESLKNDLEKEEKYLDKKRKKYFESGKETIHPEGGIGEQQEYFDFKYLTGVQENRRHLEDNWITFSAENAGFFREVIRKLYGIFLYKFSDVNAVRREAKRDDSEGSFLAKSIFQKQRYEAVVLFDAIRQVLHYVAYGSFQDYVKIHYNLKKARGVLKKEKVRNPYAKVSYLIKYDEIESLIQKYTDFLNLNH